MDLIKIRGARTHNLKNIDVTIPRDKLIVITGVSGSGKSSLAFDTIYAEGQRRYVESLSSYARQFLSVMDKPDVDHIEGLSPAISIEQKSTSHNPRSTVGTVTEIYDYLRLLFARSGTAYCPTHHIPLLGQTVSQMTDAVAGLPEGRYALLSPLALDRKGTHEDVFEKYLALGFTKAKVNGEFVELDNPPKLAQKQKHSIFLVIDRIKIDDKEDRKLRISQSLETAIGIGPMVHVENLDKPDLDQVVLSSKHACPKCNYSVPDLEPRLFSFNAPSGACSACNGLGSVSYIDVARVVRNEDLNLSQGAIAGWGKTNPGFFARIESVAKHFGVDTKTPWKKLDEKFKNALLYGTKENIRIVYQGGYSHRKPFEGVIGNLERRMLSQKPEDLESLAQYFSEKNCEVCGGSRLSELARNVFVGDESLPSVSAMTIDRCHHYFENLNIDGWRGEVAQKIIKEISERLSFLKNVGLNYLSLDRRADTLSGGEAQRIRLASQIGAGLVGVMYVLDEPSIGLHQRDNERLLGTLTSLRDMGNTVIVVEHDEEAIKAADYILDIGPMAGVHGGSVVAAGTVSDIMKEKKSLTGQYLSGEKTIKIPTRKKPSNEKIVLRGATGNNLKNITVEIPVGLFTCVTGVSGSGKSTLINDTLYAAAARHLNDAALIPAPHKSVGGLEHFDKVIDINQSPIGRTPRSNPATYTGLFGPLRDLFAQTPESRARGYSPGRFSFNVKGGRCEACSGDGLLRVEMHFLPDVYVECDVCHGKRYNNQTLEVTYKGYNISQILDMTVDAAAEVFHAVPQILKKLSTLQRVGLGYIKLGQSATTLSGGEAQRVKLSKELSKRDTGRTLYILDEPTTGLHFEDINHLLGILHELRSDGNTVVVIEHNLDVIKTADWILDIGPEGGAGGGEVVAFGSPEKVAANPKSHTGRFLISHLNQKDQSSGKVKKDPSKIKG